MANIYADGRVVTIDDEDLDRCKPYRWGLNRQFDRAVVQASINHKTRSLGRFLLDYSGPNEVDHRDHNPFNCIKSNLMIATRSQQMMNSKPQLDREYKGVTEIKTMNLRRRFRVSIKKDGKKINLGYCATLEEGARCYDRKAIELFGEFARLNFPGDAL